MLHCNKYKPKGRDNILTNGLPGFCAIRLPSGPLRIFAKMGRSADANELRCLLSLAARVRQLAAGAVFQHDRTLYLLAAEALEKHGQRLADALPEAGVPPDDLRLYRSVDLIL